MTETKKTKKTDSVQKLYNGHESLATPFTQLSNNILENAYRVRQYKPGPKEDPHDFKPKGLTSTELLFFILLLRHKHNEQRNINLSSTYAARTLGINTSSVRRLVRKLVEDELLTAKYKANKHKFSIYTLDPLFKRVIEIHQWASKQKNYHFTPLNPKESE